MHFRRPIRASDVAINVAPLVDVVFLLVIFFAVSTTFLETSGLRLELPDSASSARQELKDLTVYLGADGSLVFDGEAVEMAQLGDRVATALEGSEKKIVVLRADVSARHGEVVRIMDIVRAAGAEALTVAARPATP